MIDDLVSYYKYNEAIIWEVAILRDLFDMEVDLEISKKK